MRSYPFSQKKRELASPQWLLRNSAHALLAGDFEMSALALLFFCAVATGTDAVKRLEHTDATASSFSKFFDIKKLYQCIILLLQTDTDTLTLHVWQYNKEHCLSSVISFYILRKT